MYQSRCQEGSVVKAVSILAVLLVAVTMGLALAHALELPGKLRLNKDTYVAVQAIYYPGFTIGGLVGELGGLIVLLALLLLTPYGAQRFWWTAAAFAFLVSAHAVYWLTLLGQAQRSFRSCPGRAASGRRCATSGSIPTLPELVWRWRVWFRWRLR
jgi:hypothetical protein